MAWWFVVVTVVGLAATLLAEDRNPALRAVSKATASTGFLGVALALGATNDVYGRWVLAALVFGWIGDVALVGSARAWFLAGLAAFLVGHLLYVVAFAVVGIAPGVTIGAAVMATAVGALVFRWLRPNVPGPMVAPVIAYVVVISTMAAFAVGATAHGASALIVTGAAAFYASDLAVARNRFVAPGIVNRLWGLPLYYTGQLLLAWSVGAA